LYLPTLPWPVLPSHTAAVFFHFSSFLAVSHQLGILHLPNLLKALWIIWLFTCLY
jgi:hypothetical protein